jgi:hypothetical protein
LILGRGSKGSQPLWMVTTKTPLRLNESRR